MSWLSPALAALALLGLVLGAWLIVAARRRRGTQRLGAPDDLLSSAAPQTLDVEPAGATEHEALARSHTPMNAAPYAQPAQSEPLVLDDYDDHTVIMPSTEAESLALLSVHEKPTLEFSAFVENEGLAHVAPTVEFSAFAEKESDANNAPTLPPPPGHAEAHPELMPIDAAALQTMSKTLFSAHQSDDDVEHTSIFQPDAETLDTLRKLTGADEAPASERPRGPSTQKILKEPPPRYGAPPPPEASESERARALIQSERARATNMRSESFYIQSHVNSEERLQLKRVAMPKAPVRNDLRTSGYAPKPSAADAAPQGAQGKRRG